MKKSASTQTKHNITNNNINSLKERIFMKRITFLLTAIILAISSWAEDLSAFKFTILGGDSVSVERDNYYVSGDIVIPETVELNGVTYRVVAIPQFGFSSLYSMTSIVIPNSITTIGGSAFSSCHSLTSLHIPASVTSIGSSLIVGCTDITSLTVDPANPVYHSDGNCLIETKTRILKSGCNTSIIPTDGSVISLENYSFSQCTFTEITLPDSLQEIGNNVFAHCKNLTAFHLPEKAVKIDDGFLNFCENINTLTVDANNTVFHSAGNCIIETAKKELFKGCKTSVIPQDSSVTTIHSNAFSTVENLTSITIPSTVTEVGGMSFYNCTGLQEITCLAVTPPIGIRDNTFYGVDKSIPVYIPKGSKPIYQSTPYWTDFTNYVDNQESSGSLNTICVDGIYYLVLGVNDVVVVAPEDGSQYSGDIVIPETITVEDKTYRVTQIGESAFYECRDLKSITLPNSITAIQDSAFYRCRYMTKAVLGSGLTTIGASAFHSCGYWSDSFEVWCYAATPPETEWDSFNNLCSTSILYVGYDYVSAYKKSYDWDDFSVYPFPAFEVDGIYYNIIAGDSVEVSFAGYDDSAVRDEYQDSVVVPDTIRYNGEKYRVTRIGQSAFAYCRKLTSVRLPESITAIGARSFYSCDKLYHVNIPERITYIPEGVFKYSYGLDTITIPENVTSIDNTAFESTGIVTFNWNAKHCRADLSATASSVQSFNFGDKVEYIDDALCKEMTQLTSITIPNTVTTIGKSAFEGCSSLESVKIPNSVTEMGECVLLNCTKMRTLHIGSGLTSYPARAFAGCTGLINLTVRAEMPPYVEANTFYQVSKTLLVHVPCTSVGYYQAAYYWNEFTNYQESFLLDFLVKPADPEQGSTLIIQHPTCQNITTIFKAIPNNGYIFKGWNDGNTDNPRTEYISEDIEYIATFAPVSSAIENIVVENISNVNKVLENGTIYILRNGEKYTIDGRKVE